MSLFHKTAREELADINKQIEEVKLSIEHLEERWRLVGYPHHHAVYPGDKRKVAIKKRIDPLRQLLKKLEAKKPSVLARAKAEDQERIREENERRRERSDEAHRRLEKQLKRELAGK